MIRISEMFEKKLSVEMTIAGACGIVLGSGLIVGLSALALIGTQVVGQLQRKVVLVNLVLLAGFTIALAGHGEPAQLSPATWPGGTPNACRPWERPSTPGCAR